MQHHGIPTRLLYWTENPLVALCFAVRDVREHQTPAVWILNPLRLNEEVARVGSEVLLSSDRRLQPYLGTHQEEARQSLAPVAIQPPHNSRRLTVQKGTFTLHGTGRRSLVAHQALVGKLVKIDIEIGCAARIKAQLANAGITESVIYPELPGLCRELVEHWTRPSGVLANTRLHPTAAARRKR